ncbi:hypothetical protein HAX54_005657 [Datura stramonium]|uniref:Uncharacterized protein n=1 Tax=Datura stramonium TaxID=4076 RepID=A0ABS8T956_DATST|nr:hypothetical protein [Datura stramonium]
MLFPFSYAAPLLDHEVKVTIPSSTPRKLKFNEQPNVKSSGNQMNLVPLTPVKQASLTGKEHEGEGAKKVHARKGTRQEWVEGKDTSDFFTMDYHWVRRRRPIHNKSVRP